MSPKITKTLVVLFIVLFAVILDQVTKVWSETELASPRYPDHVIEVVVTPEDADVSLADFLAARYQKSSERDLAFMAANAKRNDQRLAPTEKLAAGDVLTLSYVSLTVIDGYFDFSYARNPGAAFSFLADASPGFRTWFFGITGILSLLLLIGLIAAWSWKHQKAMIITLALILGGAMGNIIDRFRLGYVIDFISLHIGDKYWPTFNIADAFVTCGIVLLMIDMLFNKRCNTCSSSCCSGGKCKDDKEDAVKTNTNGNCCGGKCKGDKEDADDTNTNGNCCGGKCKDDKEDADDTKNVETAESDDDNADKDVK